MPRRKKTEKKGNDTDLGITWVKDVNPASRRRQPKYIPVVTKLKENPGKVAQLASDLEEGAASSRVVSLKSAAKEVKGTFRFPIRRDVSTGLYTVYGTFEG